MKPRRTDEQTPLSGPHWRPGGVPGAGRGVLELAVSAWGRIAYASRRFVQDGCLLWSSALTFYTLMSVVPVAALVFSVAKGLGYRQILQERLSEYLAGQEEVLSYITAFADRLISGTSGGVLAGAGVLVLLWSVVMMLGTIEDAFSRIWLVTRPRTLLRRFADYLSVMLVGPVLLISSSSMAILVITHLGKMSYALGIRGIMGPVLDLCLRAVPAVLMWALFTFLYVFIPNRRVKLGPALASGAAAGLSFIILQRVYIGLQIGVSHYNAIYGSFAALPLFLTFVQLGWIVVLFGAEICNAIQHPRERMMDTGAVRFEENIAALEAASLVIRSFLDGRGPVAMAELERCTALDTRSLRAVLARLETAGIVRMVVTGSDNEPYFIPERDPSSITASEVIRAACGLVRPGDRECPAGGLSRFESLIRAFAEAGGSSGANVPLAGPGSASGDEPAEPCAAGGGQDLKMK